MTDTAAAKKPSALDALRAIGKKSPAPTTSAIATQLNDPAIAGARKDKNTVILGFDPSVSDRAKTASELRTALERAESEFTILQGEMRDYGRTKREVYNGAFKANVTTVKVPYSVDTPTGPETRYVAVVCSNKYSVQKDVVLNNKDCFGVAYSRLFVETEVKSLKPNAEELIRGVFAEAGLAGEELETAMGSLFETHVAVKTTEAFEQESAKLPEDVKAILSQAVTRSQPGLKFE
jgi:hypothetical protein